MDRDRLKEIVEGHKEKELELYYGSSKRLSLKSFKNELSSFSLADVQGMSARVIDDHKVGFSYTEELGGNSVEKMVEQAAANSKHFTKDSANTLYESNEEYESTKYYNSELEKVGIEQKKEFALKLEQLAYDYDSRISNVTHAAYCETTYRSIIANSHGLLKSQLGNLCYSYLMVVAKDGDETTTGYWDMAADSFEGLDLDYLVKWTGDIALGRLNAGEVDSGKYKAILSEDCATQLLGVFFGGSSPFFAKNVQNGTSRLAGRLEQTIASPLVTIIDDPFAPGMGRCEFDGEGVASRKMDVVSEGVLRNFFYNVYTANKDGCQSTGHGMRGGHKSRIGTAPTNLFLTNGNESKDSLFSALGDGVWIEDVEGLHSGVNIVSGDFSLSAHGAVIEGGKRGRSLKNFTISGNFFELLERIVGKANDRRTNGMGSFASPSLLIDGLNISGK